MGAVSETHRYIARSAGVRGGNPTVENIPGLPVHDVIGLLQNGETIDTVNVKLLIPATYQISDLRTPRLL